MTNTYGPDKNRFAAKQVGFETWTIFLGDCPLTNGLTFEEAKRYVDIGVPVSSVPPGVPHAIKEFTRKPRPDVTKYINWYWEPAPIGYPLNKCECE